MSHRALPHGAGRTTDPSSSQRYIPFILLAAITVLGGWLRFRHADVRPFWLDENHTYHIVNEVQGFFAMLRFWWSSFHVSDPPLYYILNYPFTGGNPTASLLAMRLPGILLGTAAIPALYFTVRMLSTRPVAIAASFALALNTFAIQYSQEYRPYSLLLLVTILYLHAQILVILRGPTTKRMIWLLIAAGMLLYTHYFGGFAVAAGYLVWLTHAATRSRASFPWKQFLAMPAILSVAYIPIVFYGISQAHNFSLSAGGVSDSAKMMEASFLAQKGYLSYWTNLPYSLGTWYLAKTSLAQPVVSLGLAGAGALLLLWRQPRQLLLIAIFTAITTLVVYAFHEVMKYPFEPRRSIFQLPLLVYAQGVAVAAPYYLLQRMMKDKRGGYTVGVLGSVAVALVFLGVSLDGYAKFDNGGNRYPSTNANWPAMVNYVAENAMPGDIMATFAAPAETWMSSNIGFNYRRSGTSVPLEIISTFKELEAAQAKHTRGVWYALGFTKAGMVPFSRYLLANAQWKCFVGGGVAYLPPQLSTKAFNETTTETLLVKEAGIHALSLERFGSSFDAQVRLASDPDQEFTLNNSNPYQLIDLEPGLMSFSVSCTTVSLDSTTWTLFRQIDLGAWQRAVDFSRWETNPSAIMTPYIGGEPALQMRYNGKADYRFFLEEAGEYDLTLEVKNDAPGPVDLRVFASNAGELPKFSFDKADNQFSQISQRVKLRAGLNGITVYYPSFRRLEAPTADPDDSYNEFVFSKWQLSKRDSLDGR